MKNIINYLRKIIFILDKKDKKNFFKIVFILILSSIFELVGITSVAPLVAILTDPSIIQNNDRIAYVYDLFNFKSNQAFIIFFAGCFFIIYSTGLFFSAFGMYALNKFATFTSFNITKNLFDSFMKRNYYFFVENHSSNLITVLHHHISAFTGSVLYPILEMSSKFLILFAIIFYLFLTNPISTLFTLILLLSAFVFAFMYSKKIFRNLGKQNVLTDNYINKLIIEILTSIKFIKIMNLEKNFSNQYINYIYQQCLIRMKLFRLTILPKFMIEFIGIFGILSLTIYLTTSKGLMESLPILAVFLLAGFKILPAINTFYANSSRIISSLTSIDIIYDYFLNKDIDNKNQIQERDVLKLNFQNLINLKNINFSYKGLDKKILKNINLKIKKNTIVGITGPSGSGKTTLLDVMLMLLDYNVGEIILDNNIIKKDKINIKSWQKLFGYVPQNVILLDDSIKKNIALGLDEDKINVQQVHKVAQFANIHQFIMDNFKDNYETKVGERGTKISGGQIQRIGIARALYNDPEILIMDEATSSVDINTEKSIFDSIYNLKNEKTIIFISHKLESLKKCDNIYYIKNGMIEAEGKYNDIINKIEN